MMSKISITLTGLGDEFQGITTAEYSLFEHFIYIACIFMCERMFRQR
jgi:hypothetical protein